MTHEHQIPPPTRDTILVKYQEKKRGSSMEVFFLSPSNLLSIPHKPHLSSLNGGLRCRTRLVSCSSSSQPPEFQPQSPDFSIPILSSISDWADQIKERRMKQKRPLYTHHKWVDHRSSLRHIRHVASSLSSRVILSLIPPVLVFTSAAAAIATYNYTVLLGFLPEFFPLLHAPSLPYQLTAPALALLLVFRTEASYARFQEGRKIWVRVMAATSDAARMAISWVRKGEDEVMKEAILRFVAAFPVALKCHIIHGSDVSGDLGKLLDKDDLRMILDSTNRPRCIIAMLSQSIQMVQLDESKRSMLESKFSSFDEAVVACEELISIPIPLSYTRLTSRFLVLWHLTLPIILWDECNWIVVPATLLSAASLYCIEEVGVLIEEPFPMLPLDELCRVNCESIEAARNEEKLIQALLLSKNRGSLASLSSNGWPLAHQHPD